MPFLQLWIRVACLTTATLVFVGWGFAVSTVTITAQITDTIYYLDCDAGRDNNNGTSYSTAWRSLDRANKATLQPGDQLLLKRDCTWAGTLRAAWSGTPAQPILIGAYGQGNLPRIQNRPGDLATGYHANVEITGSYQIIEYIETTITSPPVDPNCQNQPVGFYVGFDFRNPNKVFNGGSYNILRRSKATRHTAGVHLETNTHDNKIYYNVLSDNHVMHKLTPKSVNGSDDIGAWGILLKGYNNDVGFNTLMRNNGWCAYDSPPHGNAIELYEARNNTIHHNTSIDNLVFSELGGSVQIKADNNRYVYNLITSSMPQSRFIIARGTGSPYGPTNRTALYHNTVYFTGAGSQGIVCHAGCNWSILTAENNIIWAEEKAAYADAPFREGTNIYWNSIGDPHVQFVGFNMSATSKIVDPQFVDRNQGNYRLMPTSPARDAGRRFWWARDLDGILTPQDGAYDIGAYEDRGTSAASSPTDLSPESYLSFEALFAPFVQR